MQTGCGCERFEVNRDEETFLDQLTACLCPIPIITYPQVLLAVQREPEQRKERKDSRNISKRLKGSEREELHSHRFVCVQTAESQQGEPAT